MTPYTLLNEDTVGPYIFSCEHASNKLPAEVSTSAKDEHFLQPHWGWDIGAESVTRHLVESTDSQGILATYSRLWIDLKENFVSIPDNYLHNSSQGVMIRHARSSLH